MRSLRAICFDLDNTLWDVWPVIRRAEQAMYEYLVERYPKVAAAHTIETLRQARERTALLYPQKQHDFTFLRMQALRDHAREFGYAESMAEEAFEIFIATRNQVDLYEEVRPALDLLGRRYRLFTASNGNADLKAIGLHAYFERSIAARQIGALKPDPLVFQKVVEDTDLALEEVVYVGDDPVHDVEGARQAGMQAIWINRTEAQWPEHLEPPPYTVGTLIELADLLEALESERREGT